MNYFPNIAPTSFITHMTLSNLRWWANSEQMSPYLKAGLWDTNKNEWVSLLSKEGLKEHGLSDLSHVYPFDNAKPNTDVKIASVGEWMMENVSSYDAATIEVAVATIELGESSTDIPSIGSVGIPAHWVDQTSEAFPFSIEDSGLGVYSITVGNETKSWKTTYGCVGVSGKACPRVWSSPSSQPVPKYEPSLLPTGVNKLKVVAEDPLGHVSKTSYTQVKVDHAVPSLALTGAITEQGTLGTSRPSYELAINATDGTSENPQSGVTKTVVEVDGKVVNESAPGCTTQNCSVSRKWTLDASQYSSGTHLLKVVATDAVGLTTTKSQSFKLQPTAPPEVELAGSATQQASLGTSRPRYVLKTNTSTESGFNGMPVTPATFITSFGGTGTGKGQFNVASGNAVDSKGNLWVVDWEGGRVEQFNAKGEYLSQFGEPGANPGQLKMPLGLAIDAAGNFWVTSGDGRIQEFSSAGKFIKQFGKEGSADGSFKNPLDIAIDSKGNLWILENSRVQVLDQEGKFLFKFGTQGKGNGQLSAASGIAVAPDGSVWVADTSNNRLQKFNAAGTFLASYGEEGTGNGNLSKPDGIDIDQAGNVYVADGANRRVQVFNAAGEYLTQFGSIGSGPGQFEFPSYLSIDPSGNIWVDSGSNKVQRWHSQVAPPTFSAAFGSKGTGAGQFTTPSSVATDSAGNFWVVDRANARIEKFNAKGEFLSQFGTKGSGAGQLSSPWGIVIDPSSNVWVTDTTNTRVVEFNSKGEFLATFGTNVNKTKVEAGGTQVEKNLCTAASKNVCQAGTAGSLEGQMKEPTGIAASSGGNLYVVEKGNGRVEKFSPTGEKLAKFGGPGSGNGQFSEPTAIAVAPDGSVWVADSGNNRIEQWTSTFDPVQAVGKEGTANGQFVEPYGITVDAKGNVWVADTYMNRIQGFNAGGDFITKFGTSGAGEGQLSVPYSLTADVGGNIWIADTGHNQIQKWIPPTSKASTVTSEITIDGKAVSTKVGRCGTEACAIASEFVLENAAYLGKHTVQVKATDGLGRSTTKSLAVELQKDATNPSIEASGGLVTAPEGWVEQQSYGLNATATDAGYGVTSLAAKIDGQQVASWTGSCPDGGCKATISKSLDMNAYSGGSHPAEIIATDGAGNVTKKAWTINVDPEGHVSATEAEETLEAADATTEAAVVATTEEAISLEERADGNDPTLLENGSELESEGVPDLSTISKDPEEGFTINTPGAAIQVEPKSTNAGATEMEVAAEAAAVAGNTAANTDTVIRPTFNGVTAFQSIRDVTAPETFSWNVKLYEGQTLKAIDPRDAVVNFEDGTEAFLITAEFAHDAVGKEVPTTLSVSEGHVLTLKVEHRAAQYVYPVVAGSGWEGGFSTEIVQAPKDDYELRIEREQIEQEELERKLAEIEAAEQAALGGADDDPGGDEVWDTSSYRPSKKHVYTGPPVMVDWVHRTRRSKAEASYCSWLSCDTWHSWEVGTWFWNGTYHHVGGQASRGDTTLKCFSTSHPLVDDDLIKVGWSGPNPAPYGYGAHLNLWCNFHIGYFNIEDHVDDYFNMQDHLYGDGYQGQHIKQYYPGPLE